MQRANRFLAGLICLTLGLTGIAHAASANEGLSAQSVSGVERTRECVAEGKRLAVLFLVDESSSIKKADPLNRRVEAINRAVDALGRNLLSAAGSDNREIDVRVSVFGKKYFVLGSEWLSLRNSADQIKQQIEELASRNLETVTDYEAGLLGAERDFAEYEQKQGKSCKVLIWLSDGIIDLDNNQSSNGQEDKSYKAICGAAGVGAQLRNPGVFIFGIGLGGAIKPGDFDRMKRIVEGRSECGGVGADQIESPYGIFIEAESSEVLVQAIDTIFPEPPPPPPPCGTSTDETNCRELKIVVSAPTRTARLLISAPGSTDTITLTRPDKSKSFLLENSSFLKVSDRDIKIESLGVNARVWIDVNGLMGEWALRIEGIDAALASVSIFSEAKPSLKSDTPISLDRSSPAAVLLTVSDPDLEGLKIVNSNDITATIEKPVVTYSIDVKAKFGSLSLSPKVSSTQKGEFEILIDSDLREASAQGSLYVSSKASLDDVEVPMGDTLIPLVLDWGSDFPTVSSGLSVTDVDAGDSKKLKSIVTVDISGPKEGSGKARFTEALDVRELPPTMGDAEPKMLLDAGSNVEVAAGETKQLVAYVDPGGQANGLLKVTFYIELTNQDGKTEQVRIESEIKLFKPFDKTKFLGLLIVMLLVFLLVQIAVIWPVSRYISRVREIAVTSRAVTGEIAISADGLVSAVGLSSFEKMIEDHRSIGVTQKSALIMQVRGFTLRGFPGIMYRSLLKPKSVPTFIKRTPGDTGELTIGRQGTRKVGGATWGVISPSLSGQWAVSFPISEIRKVETNPKNDLKGQLIYILPESLNPSDPDVALRLISELATSKPRDSALRLVNSASTGNSIDAPPIVEPPPPSPSPKIFTTKHLPEYKNDLYN